MEVVGFPSMPKANYNVFFTHMLQVNPQFLKAYFNKHVAGKKNAL
jgi:hypothetical protein